MRQSLQYATHVLHMCKMCYTCAAHVQNVLHMSKVTRAPLFSLLPLMHASAAALPLYYVLHIAIVRSSHHGDGNVNIADKLITCTVNKSYLL